VIDWSWWYVLMPLYIVPALIVSVMLALLLFGGVTLGIAAIIEKIRR